MKYLYNGVELPALPEWDKEKYPYAVIIYGNSLNPKSVTFYVSKEIVVQKPDYDGVKLVFERDYMKTTGTTYSDDFAWGELKQPTSTSSPYINYAIWANTDIYNPDGTLYLAASEPVPVTDHNALVQGWIVGKRLAAMRGKA